RPGVQSLEERLTPDFGFAWAFNLGGPANEFGSKVLVDPSGNVCVAGSFGGTVDFDPGPGEVDLSSGPNAALFVAKYTSAGELVWAECIAGGPFHSEFGMAQDGAGNLWLAGDFEGPTDFDPGPGTFTLNNPTPNLPAGFLLKLTGNGSFVFA